MLSLKSPKINVGVHCLKLRTKSMYINPVVDPDEAALYDPYDNSAAANAAAANYDVCLRPHQTKLVGGGSIGLSQDPQFVLRGERLALGVGDHLRVRLREKPEGFHCFSR